MNHKMIFILMIMILFLLSSIPGKYSLIPELKLSGVQVDIKKPVFSKSGFFSGEYQKNYSDWINQNFTLRTYYIKLYSQLLYSVFNKSAVKSVVIEKEGYLYEPGYIYSYYNLPPEEPVDVKIIEEKVNNIRIIQDYYKKNKKVFLLIITPNKATIYPEYIRDIYPKDKINIPGNYKRFVDLLDKNRINYADLYKVLLEVKRKPDLPTTLFSKGGSHWNKLGAFFALEGILHNLRNMGVETPDIKIEKIKISNSPDSYDRDLAKLMGLFKPPFYRCEAPVIELKTESHLSGKKSIVFQGGSFLDQIIEVLNMTDIFSSVDYYWYMKDVRKYPAGERKKFKLDEVDWESFLSKDILILEVNQQYIPLMGSGFPEELVKVINQRN